MTSSAEDQDIQILYIASVWLDGYREEECGEFIEGRPFVWPGPSGILPCSSTTKNVDGMLLTPRRQSKLLMLLLSTVNASDMQAKRVEAGLDWTQRALGEYSSVASDRCPLVSSVPIQSNSSQERCIDETLPALILASEADDLWLYPSARPWLSPTEKEWFRDIAPNHHCHGRGPTLGFGLEDPSLGLQQGWRGQQAVRRTVLHPSRLEGAVLRRLQKDQSKNSDDWGSAAAAAVERMLGAWSAI